MNLNSANDQLEHALLTAWLDAGDIGLCVADDDGKAVMLNATACRQLGVQSLTALDRSLRYLFREFEDSVSVLEWIDAPMTGLGRQVVRQEENKRIHLLLKKRHIQHSNGERFRMISLTDVSELIDAQRTIAQKERIEEQKRQWQALNAGVVIVDVQSANMPITYVNPVFEQMSGYTFEEVVGRNCKFLQGDEQEQPALADIRRAIKTRTNGYAVLRNYRKDGSLFINELFISPIKDTNGEVVQFIGIQHLRSAS